MNALGYALVPLILCTVVAAQSPSPKAARAFEAKKTKVLAEAGQRHLRLGSWCRKIGLVPQATAQFLRAQEVAEGRNPGAVWLVRTMRSLDDRFWRGTLQKPSSKLLATYAKRARALDVRDRKDRFGLAAHADKLKLESRALAAYRSLLDDSDAALMFDKQGRIRLPGGVIPADIAAHFRDEAVEINGELQLRDKFLAGLPDVAAIYEATSPMLRVRSEVSRAQAEELHALGTALLPHLEEYLGGAPTRPLNLFVFAKRDAFGAYLRNIGRPNNHADGIADYGSFVAVALAEGKDTKTLQAVCLHEITHLFDHGLAPAVMPSWYDEALAETFGGVGTFTWDGETLTVAGELEAYRLKPLAADEHWVPLERLLSADAWEMMVDDRDGAGVFYAESWAFLRYLRTAAGAEVAQRLRRWEAQCRGAALGAVPGQRRQRNTVPAKQLFEEMFAGELDALATGFKRWVRER